MARGSVYAVLLAQDAPMVAADRCLDAAIIAGNTQRLAHWILVGKHYKSFDDLRGATSARSVSPPAPARGVIQGFF
jgi:hypothetical protein